MVTSPASANGDTAFPRDAFADVLAANETYAARFGGTGLTGRAARGLAVVTCMDSRIDPLGILGMSAGDVKILRNAGARVTDDVLRTLVLASYLLGVERVLVMPHTDCKMASASEAEIHATIAQQYGVDTRSLEIRTVSDQQATLAGDLQRIRSYPFLPQQLVVAGAVYDVATGALRPADL
ncbi:MAG: carbonic anhydrase [Actinomycetota bacterium]|nr:MAG: carbonic anhydrase [Actinomycetota bacterium]